MRYLKILILQKILKNIDLAKKSSRPMCQDTGIQTFFVDVGVDFPQISRLKDLITDAVKTATQEVPLRPNTVDPFSGENHKDNTGEYIPYVTWDFVKGSDVLITAFPKGGGSENMSKLGMLKPGVGLQGVKDFVVEEMLKAGGQPCPPTVVGVGIGGGADLSLKLGKKALLRPVGVRHKDKSIAAMEEELIKRINKSGIGPMGLGGKTTVLDVHVEVAHRHPATRSRTSRNNLPNTLCFFHKRTTMIQCHLRWIKRQTALVFFKHHKMRFISFSKNTSRNKNDVPNMQFFNFFRRCR